MFSSRLVSVLALTAFASTAAAQSTQPSMSAAAKERLAGSFVTTDSGLQYRDVVPGTGDGVAEGDSAVVHYTGWLTTGEKFDSSHDRDAPYTVRNVGRASVIRGWNEGLVGMKKGGTRRLVIPPELGYGSRSRSKIPANSTLVFDIELLDIKAGPKPLAVPPKPDLSTLALVSSPTGLRHHDLVVGDGPVVRSGGSVAMHYAGYLEDGTLFDSSYQRGETFPVRNVGAARVIKGWNEGLVGMKIGGKRVLVIPGALAYGERGFAGVIPPNATLIFVVEAVEQLR